MNMTAMKHAFEMPRRIDALLARAGLRSLFRYGLVGICAAVLHAGTAFALRYGITLDATLANLAGFIAGAFISYLGSFYFTFESTDRHANTLPRFILVWLIGIAINVGLFHWAITAFELPFPVSVFLAIVITPIAQFILLRFYAFRKPK